AWSSRVRCPPISSASSTNSRSRSMAIVCSTRVFAIDVEHVPLSDGRTHEVATARHAPCVVLIPVLDDGRIVLIRQYRHSVKRVLWEFPAGSIDPEEAPE